MKIQQTHRIAYTEVKPDYTIQLRSLLGLLQDAAVAHSEQVGLGSRELLDTGTVWVLHKMAVDIVRLPRYRETVRVETWHRGSRGFRAYRDFIVSAGSERLVAATSLWLYFDLGAKRLQRIPRELSQAYTEELEDAGCGDLDAWKPAALADDGFKVAFTTRSSDFDPLGHVNHTVYFDMLETLIERARGPETVLRRLRIHFQKEIACQVTGVAAALESNGHGGRFRIYSEAQTFAAGDLEIDGPTG
jgi:acyl-ACP thioesterase